MRETDLNSPLDTTGRLELPQKILLMLGSVCAIEFAVQQNQGHYLDIAVQGIALALLLLVAAVAGIQLSFLRSWSGSRMGVLMVVVLGYHLYLLETAEPGAYLTLPGNIKVFRIGVITLALAGVAALASRPVLGRWHAPLLLAVFTFAGWWILHHSPDPGIDSFTMQQESSKALLEGRNPWAITYPNVYHSSQFHPPGFTTDDRILLGYGYPPVTLLMVAPGYLLSGDHRWGQLVAILLTGAIMCYVRRTAWGIAIAALFFTSPRIFQVLECSWTESLVMLLLAAVVYCAVRFPVAVPWVFGIFLSSKQHMFIFAPAAMLLLPRPLRWREVGLFYAKAFGVAVAMVLPFFLWDPGAFWHSVVEFQLQYHPRADSLSFSTFVARHGFGSIPRFISLALVALAYLLVWWRVPRTIFGFGLTIAFVGLVCFAFDQSFLNRYYFVMASIYLTLACIPANNADALLHGDYRVDEVAGFGGGNLRASSPAVPR